MPQKKTIKNKNDLDHFIRAVALPVSSNNATRNSLRQAMASFWSFADRGVADGLVRESASFAGVDCRAVTHAATQWCTIGAPNRDVRCADDEVALLFAIPILSRAADAILPPASVYAETLYRNLVRDGEITVSKERFSLYPHLLHLKDLPCTPDTARTFFYAILPNTHDEDWPRCLPASHLIPGVPTERHQQEHLDTKLSLIFVAGVCVVKTTHPVFPSRESNRPLCWPEALADALQRESELEDVIIVPPSPYFLQSLSLGMSFCSAQALMLAARFARSATPTTDVVNVHILPCKPDSPSTLQLAFSSLDGTVLSSTNWSVGNDDAYSTLNAVLRQAADVYMVNIDHAIPFPEQRAD